MSASLDLKLDPDKAQEIPMVDLAFLILKAANAPFYYRDLMKEVAKLRQLTEEQIQDVIAQLYTEINIDGRFACVGQNLWGLKRWYPVDRSGEKTLDSSHRPRIINDEDDFSDEDDHYHEEEFDYADEGNDNGEENLFDSENSNVDEEAELEADEDEDEEDDDMIDEQADDEEEDQDD